MKPSQELVKKYSWTIRVNRPGGDETCRYNGSYGPITAEHVRQAPSVKLWIGNDRLISIIPTNP